MAYEYHNPHPRKLEITLPFGKSFLVGQDEYIPTPEMEKKGITADILTDFVRKNLLHPTPPEKRAMFFRPEAEVPAENTLSPTTIPAVEAKIEGGEGAAKTEKKAKVTSEDMMRMIRSKIEKSDKPMKSVEESLQAIADATCSSFKVKKPSKE